MIKYLSNYFIILIVIHKIYIKKCKYIKKIIKIEKKLK